ncbi:DNA repair protein RecO [soil metagenome]
MLQKTRGVVLHVTEYAEASVIVKVFTETFGIQSFLINGVRKQKARFAANLFQPLSLLEIVAYHKRPGGLHRVSDVTASPPLSNIPYDTVKTTMAIFISEVLYRSIREEECNPELFHFIDHAVQMLDLHEETVSRFHLCFMVQLSRYLGFYPSGRFNDSSPFFDLREGMFQDYPPNHPLFLDRTLSSKFDQLLQYNLEDAQEIILHATERKEILNALVTYYELHHTQGAGIHSHEILAEILT